MESELFPVVGGIVVGIILGWFAPRLQLWIGTCLAVVLGILATIVSGEFQISWAFLLVDIPLVALSAACTLILMRRWRIRSWTIR